jgi:hypothetical protein
VALFGVDPNWRTLLTEILKSHGFASRGFSEETPFMDWLNGEGTDCPLLIAEMDPDGPAQGGFRAIRASFPGLRMLTVPPGFRPLEVFRLIEAALPVLNEENGDTDGLGWN